MGTDFKRRDGEEATNMNFNIKEVSANYDGTYRIDGTMPMRCPNGETIVARITIPRVSYDKNNGFTVLQNNDAEIIIWEVDDELKI